MKTATEIIKNRYPFYDENISMKDVELNGEAVKELMEEYASQFKSGEMPDNEVLLKLYDKHASQFYDSLDEKIYALEYSDLKDLLSEIISSPPSKAESDAVRFAEYVIKKGYKLTIALPEIYAQFKLTNK